MWVTKHLISPVKKRIFCPRTTKFGLKLAFLPGLAGLFGALLVGRLVVVARGLYLARHLFTLLILFNAKTSFLVFVGKICLGSNWRTSVKRGGERGTPLADKIHEIVFDSIANQQQAKPKPYYVQFQTTKMLQEITHRIKGIVPQTLQELRMLSRSLSVY